MLKNFIIASLVKQLLLHSASLCYVPVNCNVFEENGSVNWLIYQFDTVIDALSVPFYHTPVKLFSYFDP